MPIASISRYWFGDFLLLWRPPLAVVKSLVPGMRGAEVKWLRENLRVAQGLPEAAQGSDFYDEELTRLVQDFQREHRLNADGVAGVQTQIVLDTVLNPAGSPTLGGERLQRRRLSMSFILDALRKSEHARQKQTGPGLAEVPVVVAKPKTNVWATAAVALLLVNLIAVGVLLLRRANQEPPPPVATNAPAATTTIAAAARRGPAGVRPQLDDGRGYGPDAGSRRRIAPRAGDAVAVAVATACGRRPAAIRSPRKWARPGVGRRAVRSRQRPPPYRRARLP